MNPYSFVDPVTESDMFYGYQAELDKIVNRVAAPHKERQSFFILGARLMGKTSLLLQIEQRLRLLGPERTIGESKQVQVVIPLYIDMLNLGVFSPASFFEMVSDKLRRYLTTTHFHFDIPPQVITGLQAVGTATRPAEAFEECLSQLVQAVEPRQLRVVLLIDDLWRAGSKEMITPISLSLRSLHIAPAIRYVLAYVITGSYHELEEIRHLGSPLENILVRCHLHAFDKEQSLALINEPTGGKLPAEVVQEVYIQSGGHPFLIQYLMSELYKQGNLAQLNIEDVAEAMIHFQNERKDFENWWEKLGKGDRKVYEAFFQTKHTSANNLASMMLSIAPSSGDGRYVLLDKLMITDSLFALSTAGFVRRVSESNYELAGEWPARWFRDMRQDKK